MRVVKDAGGMRIDEQEEGDPDERASNSHDTSLAFNDEGLTKLGLEIEPITCVKRSSLPDVSEKMGLECGGVTNFSQISSAQCDKCQIGKEFWEIWESSLQRMITGRVYVSAEKQ
ncbi:hypothetical protein L6452_15298 [Arctium lappa]|uniref:Uncharacterized protein n=1 Tax=Arctium lappa TaxID=4217 RepID=A0ACB9CNJ8_ARCLA|nr:hypothetical protein L6452_15298 [Arctium lappa]